MYAASGSNGQGSAVVYGIHALYLAVLIFLIVLNDAERVDPKIPELQFVSDCNSVFDSWRKFVR
jgi:hypothetical protein